MADCKKALEETNGDIPKAIEYLRKKGAAMATKRAKSSLKTTKPMALGNNGIPTAARKPK